MGDPAHRAPGGEFLGPLIARDLGKREPALDAELCGIAAGLLDPSVDSVDDRLSFGARAEVGHPAVGDARGPADGALALAAHPDRDRALYRQRVEAGVGH